MTLYYTKRRVVRTSNFNWFYLILEIFAGANKMNPETDKSIAEKYRGLTRKFLNLLYKTDDERSNLLEKNIKECRKSCKCLDCFTTVPDLTRQ